jgi:hypothetical protein
VDERGEPNSAEAGFPHPASPKAHAASRAAQGSVAETRRRSGEMDFAWFPPGMCWAFFTAFAAIHQASILYHDTLRNNLKIIPIWPRVGLAEVVRLADLADCVGEIQSSPGNRRLDSPAKIIGRDGYALERGRSVVRLSDNHCSRALGVAGGAVRNCVQSIPSRRMRERSVCGLIPSRRAAPNGPSMRPNVAASVLSMCCLIA